MLSGVHRRPAAPAVNVWAALDRMAAESRSLAASVSARAAPEAADGHADLWHAGPQPAAAEERRPSEPPGAAAGQSNTAPAANHHPLSRRTRRAPGSPSSSFSGPADSPERVAPATPTHAHAVSPPVARPLNYFPRLDPLPVPTADSRLNGPTGRPSLHAGAGSLTMYPPQAACGQSLRSTSADITLRTRGHHVIDIDPPDAGEAPLRRSGSRVGQSVSDHLAVVARSVLPLQDAVRGLRAQPPSVPPGELAARMNQRFDLYVQREVERPLDMPRLLEFVKEREHQLALPKSEQNWDKAVQLFKQAMKIDMAQAEKGWQSAGSMYPLGSIPSNVLTLLPSLAAQKFSSLRPVAAASTELGLQVGLMVLTPVLNAWTQKFAVNLSELKRVAGRPALAASTAPEFGPVTESIQKALVNVDSALSALGDVQAGPAEAAHAAHAEKQLVDALEAYDRRVEVNNINYTAQHWQNISRSARQFGYFLAPVLGNYLGAGGNGRYISYGVQVASTVGMWIAQQFASPKDEKGRQETTILARAKQFDMRKASTVAGNVAVNDLTEDDLDVRKFRAQWQGPDAARLSAVTDVLASRINEHSTSAAQLAGLTLLDWGRLQALESRRQESSLPLSQAERARMADIRQQPHEHISRPELLEWMDLEERARDPLSAAEDREFSALQAKFKTSTMSESTWGRLQELAMKSDADPNSLTWPEHEELAQLRERSASSLTVAEHARLETLRIRSKISPDAKDAATRAKLEDKAGLSEAERAVLTRANRAQGNVGLPASADDFRAMGAIHTKLRAKLDGKEQADHADALSRLSCGLTRAEKAEYVELRNKGRLNMLDAKAVAELRRLEMQTTELRLDTRLLNWDWSKLSGDSQSVVEGVLGGKSDVQATLLISKARMSLRQEIAPEVAQRYGSSLQMIFGGSSMPFVVGAGFRMASALGKNVPFESVRIPAGLATLAIGIMGAWATGALTNFKIAERARLRKQGESAPSMTQLLLSSIPRAMFALPAEVAQIRRGAQAAASGKQWVIQHGERLRLAVQLARQRADAQQATGGPAPVPVAPQHSVPREPQARQLSAGSTPDLSRSGDWLRAMDELLAATANVQQHARDLMNRAPRGAAAQNETAAYALPV